MSLFRRRNYIAAARNLCAHYARLAPQLARLAAVRARALGPAGFARWVLGALTPQAAPPPRAHSARVELALRRLRALEAPPPPPPAPASGASKPRLAMVTPFPPDRTGIAVYAAELAGPLSRYYDVTVIAASADGRPPIEGGPPVRSEAWFARHGAEFDRVLYHLGNAPFHAGMPALLESWPGVVVLHDFGLGDLCADMQARGIGEHWWARTLYASHGYGACHSLAMGRPAAELVAVHPCSGFVFEQSQGVLVHSRFAQDLARRHYGQAAAAKTAQVPFLQRPLQLDRATARAALGLAPGELLVCSFGFIGPSKLTDRLLEAWGDSGLAERGRLVLVGALPQDAYGADLRRRLADLAGARVSVTGYASREAFEQHLAAADVAVQLRACSRGESSGALFDCLAAGVASLVNAHGALAEIPREAVLMLPDCFSQNELTAALQRLASDADLRRRLGEAGRALVRTAHDPQDVAARYHELIERFARATPALHDAALLARLRRQALATPEPDAALVDAARELARTCGGRMERPRLFVDVTAIAADDLGTGVQRVVRAQLLQLIRRPPAGYRVEPVRIADTPAGPELVYARAYAARLLGLPRAWLADAPATPEAGDVYYMPDLAPDAVARAAEAGLYRRLRDAGVAIHVLVHDVLPLEMPECFPAGAAAGHARWLQSVAREADQLICISDAVRQSVRTWLARNAPAELERLRLSRLHHGADIEASAAAAPAAKAARDARGAIAAARERPSLLMVGTVEPRKGYEQALAAFEALWARRVDVNLVVVGAEGWRDLSPGRRRSIPDTVRLLRTHREAGRRLFWLPAASDAALTELFRSSTGLLAASWGEGFGLPLIEAARHGLPILARDIPIFREVAGAHAAYFSAATPDQLAEAVETWLARRRAGDHPRPDGMPYLTWAQNVQQLTALLGLEAASPGADLPPGGRREAGRTARRRAAA